MRAKQHILFSLFSAYMLVLAHAIIPHHHHSSLEEAEQHHQHEHTVHHHNDEHSGGHDHSTHFVHPPDFGNFIASSTRISEELGQEEIKSCKVNKVTIPIFIVESIKDIDWPPDFPTPYQNNFLFDRAFRGPPVS